jgi:hemoglobin-like flavoprotein
MTQAQLQRIEASYEMLAGRMHSLTASFYERLFKVLPECRPLFRIDIDLQSQHLAAALALIVRNLRMLDVLEQPLMELGVHHTHVGVRPEHYPIVCQTMVQALADGAGEAWSPQLQADWTDVLELVSQLMLQGSLRHFAGDVASHRADQQRR